MHSPESLFPMRQLRIGCSCRSAPGSLRFHFKQKGLHACVCAHGEEESIIDIACYRPSQDRATNNFQFNIKIKRKTFSSLAVQLSCGKRSMRCEATLWSRTAAVTGNGNIVYGFLHFCFAPGMLLLDHSENSVKKLWRAREKDIRIDNLLYCSLGASHRIRSSKGKSMANF